MTAEQIAVVERHEKELEWQKREFVRQKKAVEKRAQGIKTKGYLYKGRWIPLEKRPDFVIKVEENETTPNFAVANAGQIAADTVRSSFLSDLSKQTDASSDDSEHLARESKFEHRASQDRRPSPQRLRTRYHKVF